MNAAKIKPPEGCTVLEHRIRHTLKLTVEEYCMADLIYRHNKRFPVGFCPLLKYYTELAFLEEDVMRIGAALKSKGIVIKDKKKNRWNTSVIWNIHFDEESQFATLWKLNNRGTKQKANENFLKMRGMIGFNALVLKLQEYMNSVEDKQYVMKLEKWLDPKYKRWEDEIEFKGGESNSSSNSDESIPTHLFQ